MSSERPARTSAAGGGTGVSTTRAPAPHTDADDPRSASIRRAAGALAAKVGAAQSRIPLRAARRPGNRRLRLVVGRVYDLAVWRRRELRGERSVSRRPDRSDRVRLYY